MMALPFILQSADSHFMRVLSLSQVGDQINESINHRICRRLPLT
jgi:hypothetical protein